MYMYCYFFLFILEKVTKKKPKLSNGDDVPPPLPVSGGFEWEENDILENKGEDIIESVEDDKVCIIVLLRFGWFIIPPFCRLPTRKLEDKRKQQKMLKKHFYMRSVCHQ